MKHPSIEDRPPHPDPEGLWSADQAAAFLGIPRKAIYQLRREGLLRGTWLSERRLRFHPADVIALAEDGRDP